ncbi:MAG TPA: CoB--CoM heterodisulfide reductase iron-sulfur subunit B family protein [Candidatus Goldiibacteriota bacterium]|nr:CoB--CoM heterodisulfide reductase iron-sulfur subunit B family protein [Candidatus Goldiibacteriota bacterium]
MKTYAFYPGCSLEVSNRPYLLSIIELFKALNSELKELEDWNCCGATLYMGIDEINAVYMSARNLAIAEKNDFDLLNACSACFLTLKKAKDYLLNDRELMEKINSLLKDENLKFTGKTKIRHVLEVLYNDFREQIPPLIKRKLNGLKLACYYGCQVVRPKTDFDDPEFPQKMDELVNMTGANSVFFSHKTKCCGGMLMTTSEDVCLKMVRDILLSAQNAGAEAIVTVCPLCQMNLEAYQGAINKKYGTKFNVPILYLTQILGYAMGIDRDKLGINQNFINADKVLAK